jgi:aminotransferase
MPAPELVREAACRAINAGKNTYTFAQGIIELREAIAGRLRTFNKISWADAASVLVTTGSTGAFEAICAAFLKPGDEVISFIPFYPYHRNTLERYGVKTVHVELHAPTWAFDLEQLRAAVTPRTKFVLLTTPNNPTGKVFSRSELDAIAALCCEHNLSCVTDEVYEYMTYDGLEHISIATLPGMAERTITMSSYSKTFAITGWRIGFLHAPARHIDVLRFAADSLYVCAPAPLQHGVAAGVSELGADYYENLRADYARKREILRAGLSMVGLKPSVPKGAYYMIASTSELFPGKTSEEAVDIMINKAAVGAVPASDFLGPSCKGDPGRSNFLRFSFGVPDELLQEAAGRLQRAFA